LSLSESTPIDLTSLRKRRPICRPAHHKEQRPTDVYTLVVAKGGIKFQKAAGSGERNCQRIVGGSDNPAAKGLSSIQAGSVCANMTMEDFAGLLAEMAPAYLDRPVVDLTGLTGTYDFKPGLGQPSSIKAASPCSKPWRNSLDSSWSPVSCLCR